MASVYFDTSVFLAILNREPTAPRIRGLLSELKSQRTRIVTSILTVQEVSVLAYRRGTVATDDHVTVGKLARIETITREVALTAAKFEATVKDAIGASGPDDNRRRKWDCFHLATAVMAGCQTFYALDDKFSTRKAQLGLGLDVRDPIAVSPRFAEIPWTGAIRTLPGTRD